MMRKIARFPFAGTIVVLTDTASLRAPHPHPAPLNRRGRFIYGPPNESLTQIIQSFLRLIMRLDARLSH